MAFGLRQQDIIYSFVCGFVLGKRNNRTRKRWYAALSLLDLAIE
jgi:hypothetical protein